MDACVCWRVTPPFASAKEPCDEKGNHPWNGKERMKTNTQKRIENAVKKVMTTGAKRITRVCT